MRNRSRPGTLSAGRMIHVAIGLAALFWVVESGIHVVAFRDGAWAQQLVTQDPHEIWMRFLVACLLVAFGCCAQCITTKRKRAEERLKRSREFCETVLSSVTDAVSMISTGDFRIVGCNRAFLEALGFKEEQEVIGKTCYELTHRRSQPCTSPDHTCPLRDALTDGKDSVVEHVHYGKDAKQMVVQVFASPTKDENGETTQIVHILRDVTDRKRAEEELRQYRDHLEELVQERTGRLRVAVELLKTEIDERKQVEEALVEAKRTAEAANKAKSDFLTRVSHEVRTPLNSIMGFSEVMIEGMAGPVTGVQEEYLNDILEGGKHLLHLINDLLDLSKVEMRKTKLGLEECCLRTVLEESLSMFKERALKHQIYLGTDIPEDIGFVTADDMAIKQVLLNLLSNAFKFTPDGGEVGVTARKTKGEVQVTVWDTGIGISEEDLPKLFRPFQQIETTLTKKHPGTGLGLYYSKKLVELHGGSIWLESKVDRGSRFTFTIPTGAD